MILACEHCRIEAEEVCESCDPCSGCLAPEGSCDVCELYEEDKCGHCGDPECGCADCYTKEAK